MYAVGPFCLFRNNTLSIALSSGFIVSHNDHDDHNDYCIGKGYYFTRTRKGRKGYIYSILPFQKPA